MYGAIFTGAAIILFVMTRRNASGSMEGDDALLKRRRLTTILSLVMVLLVSLPVFAAADEAEKEWVDTYVETSEEALGVLAEMKPDDAETRVIVSSSELEESYGASEVTYLAETEQYILKYDTPEDAQEAVASMPEDVDAKQDKKLTLANLAVYNQSEGAYSWGSNYLGMSPYRDGVEGYDGDTIIVAVLDTGIDLHNGFFQGETIRSDSHDFTESPNGIQDQFGHGTHVAGIIADATPANVELLILRVFDDNGESSWSWISAAIQYAVDKGADVLNLSFGDDTETGDPLASVLDAAEASGMVVVCAAGNESPGTVWYPANKPSTIAVTNINKKEQLASDSSYGDTVDFCAPGVNIISATKNPNADGTSYTQSMSGTSMATPHVAAEFAYLKMKNPDMTPAELKQEAIRLSCDLGEEGWDNKFGHGYIDLTDYFETKERVPGDIDLDGTASVTDLLHLKRYLADIPNALSEKPNEASRLELADFDEDGEITIKDLLLLKRLLSGIDLPSSP